MEKRVILLMFAMIFVVSCRKDDDGECVETTTYVSDTNYWFVDVADTSNGVFTKQEITAKSSDRISEIFKVDYHRSPHFNPATICEKTVGDDYKYIDYSASLYDIGFVVIASGFGIDPKIEFLAGDAYILGSYFNNQDRVVYSFKTGKLTYGPQPAQGKITYVGDTVINSKIYSDIYLVTGLAYPNTDIKKMLFSVKRGVIIYQKNDTDREWILDN